MKEQGQESPQAAAKQRAGFAPLADDDTLAGVFAQSHDAPVLLFLHDPHCPISRRAWQEMQQLPQSAFTNAYLVDVSRQRILARAVEAQTGVRHESPQSFVLRHGKAVWDASHFAITAKDVSRHIVANS